jgi:RNA polymerase sigma factor (sigma-70 family)
MSLTDTTASQTNPLAPTTPPTSDHARCVIDADTDTSIVVLVTRQVRAGHVSDSDRDDLTQFLRKELLCRAHRYRPEQGAWPTFVRRVLEGEFKRWLRHHLRERRDRRLAQSIHGDDGSLLSPWATALPDQQSKQQHVASELCEALAAVLARLNAADRDVAETLMRMCPLQAARHLGRSRSDIYRVMARLRDVLLAAGIEA